MESKSRMEMESKSGKERERESRPGKERERESGKLMDHQSELSILHEEIMSLVSERKNLLASLSPNLFVWEDLARRPDLTLQQEVREEDLASTWRIAGKVSAQKMDSSLAEPASVSTSRPNSQQEALENYMDSILQDMEDLGHRMLSVADNAKGESDTASSLYMKAELFATASRLWKISEDLSNDTGVDVVAQAEAEMVILGLEERAEAEMVVLGVEERAEAEMAVLGVEERAEAEMAVLGVEERNMALPNEFVHLCKNYLERPHDYRKHLALIITEEEKKEMEEEKEKGKEKGKEKEEDYDGVFDEETESKGYLKKRMLLEQGFFTDYRICWEQIWGSEIGRCGGFQDTTTLSPMHFTNCTPGIIPSGSVAGTTLQVYSFQIEPKADLKWPLRVYGMVAARDTVDRNRNLLFCRSRIKYQVLTLDDPFLCLIGPSRAILGPNPIYFEVELKINDGHDSQDRSLISLSIGYSGEDILLFDSCLCTGKLCLEPIYRSIQATIVGIQLAEGDWPFKYGCRVACSSSGREVLLLDTQGEEIPVGSDGYLTLARNVVSLETTARLKVHIQAYSISGSISAQGHVYLRRPKHRRIRQRKCKVGDSRVLITVAWSRLVEDKRDLFTQGYASQA